MQLSTSGCTPPHRSQILDSKKLWTERLAAATEDRKALFDEANRIEQDMNREKAAKVASQQAAAHYRNLLKDYM